MTGILPGESRYCWERVRNVAVWAFRALFFALLICGCSSRKPVAGHPPASTQPATPEPAKETTNNSTPAPAASSKPAARRNRPAVPPLPQGFTEEGDASWYGIPFNGRRASNGEIYDMYKMTAAHRTYPFDTMVRVTNLSNGKSAVVRITDRGPFVENRVIDLSFAAAQEIASIGPGVVRVRLEVISGTPDPTGGYFTVQVGAFRERANAERLRERLNAAYSPIYIQPFDSPDGTFYRVRVGKIAGEDAARQYAARLHAQDEFTTFVVRLDEGAAAPANGTSKE
jgi:peptidoglycan lytic transglycosylase